MKLYMVTGFLGAGKTSFLKNLIALFEDRVIYLIINEFGKEAVDGTLLKEMQVTLSEINNGSIFCACRLDKFEEELENVIDKKPEIIIVETSGLSDPTNVKSILQQEKYKEIEYMGCMCIIDAKNFRKVYATAQVIRKQLAVSSIAVVNKTDQAEADELAAVETLISEIMPAAKIFETTYGKMERGWLDFLTPAIDVESAINAKDITLQNALIELKEGFDATQLKGLIDLIKGESYRIKGFVRIADNLYYVDGVSSDVQIKEQTFADAEKINKIVVLAGKGMPLRGALKDAQKWYSEYIERIEMP